MQFFKLLAPAALVALASAQYYEDEQFEILAREAAEAPGYDDLGIFIRDAEKEDDHFDLETREAEAEPEDEILFSSATDILLAARDAAADGDFDSLIALEEREADPEAEALAEPKKKKKSKKGKKRKSKKCKKGKKGKKCRAAKKKARKNKAKKNGKGKSKKSPAQKKKAAAAKKQAKEDADLWG